MCKKFKTLLGIILCISIVITSLPMIAAADESNEIFSVSDTAIDNVVSDDVHILSEIIENREFQTKHFEMSDGTIKACVYPQNVHFIDYSPNCS